MLPGRGSHRGQPCDVVSSLTDLGQDHSGKSVVFFLQLGQVHLNLLVACRPGFSTSCWSHCLKAEPRGFHNSNPMFRLLTLRMEAQNSPQGPVPPCEGWSGNEVGSEADFSCRVKLVRINAPHLQGLAPHCKSLWQWNGRGVIQHPKSLLRLGPNGVGGEEVGSQDGRKWGLAVKNPNHHLIAQRPLMAASLSFSAEGQRLALPFSLRTALIL
jgi:hypothetical protein